MTTYTGPGEVGFAGGADTTAGTRPADGARHGGVYAVHSESGGAMRYTIDRGICDLLRVELNRDAAVIAEVGKLVYIAGHGRLCRRSPWDDLGRRDRGGRVHPRPARRVPRGLAVGGVGEAPAGRAGRSHARPAARDRAGDGVRPRGRRFRGVHARAGRGVARGRAQSRIAVIENLAPCRRTPAGARSPHPGGLDSPMLLPGKSNCQDENVRTLLT